MHVCETWPLENRNERRKIISLDVPEVGGWKRIEEEEKEVKQKHNVCFAVFLTITAVTMDRTIY